MFWCFLVIELSNLYLFIYRRTYIQPKLSEKNNCRVFLDGRCVIYTHVWLKYKSMLKSMYINLWRAYH